MTDYRYRVVSRCVPGSKSYIFYEELSRGEGEVFTNSWQVYSEYQTEAACKGIITRLNKISNFRIYGREIEWRIQRQPINPDWELR